MPVKTLLLALMMRTATEPRTVEVCALKIVPGALIAGLVAELSGPAVMMLSVVLSAGTSALRVIGPQMARYRLTISASLSPPAAGGATCKFPLAAMVECE